MDETKVLVKLPVELWQRVRARAKEKKRDAKDLVAAALRLYLSTPEGVPVSESVQPEPQATGRPTLESLRSSGLLRRGVELLTPEQRARRDYLREHPELESQDGEDERRAAEEYDAELAAGPDAADATRDERVRPSVGAAERRGDGEQRRPGGAVSAGETVSGVSGTFRRR